MRFHDTSKHSVYTLYVTGTRFAVGFTAEDAVDRYMELHPEADRQAVEQELLEEMQKHQW